MSPKYQPTPEQLALSRQRKLRNLERQQTQNLPQDTLGVYDVEDLRGQILPREWIQLNDTVPQPEAGSHRVKVMTWNMLAQTLVRREHFPVSDCLKSAQREHMLYREILTHEADICCLQEVDQTEKLFPKLKAAGYSLVYKTGPKKKHGSLIAYRQDLYAAIYDRTVFYDDEYVRPETELPAHDESTPWSEQARRGSSIITKNVGNIVALRRNADEDDGLIVATTHLFWHPRYTYERTRQLGILVREIMRTQRLIGKPHWPCILAGDFNFQPNDAAYALLVGDALLPHHHADLAFSRVVHMMLDPSVAPAGGKLVKEDEDEAQTEESDPDRVIVNARPARSRDGLLSDSELQDLFTQSEHAPRITSAYDEGLRLVPHTTIDELSFGSRVNIPVGHHGAFEPVWTSYTHYWKTVLDYIFVFSPLERPVNILGLAKPHPTKDLDPGIPRKGVCGSDHISLCAKLSWLTVRK